MIRLGVNIDHVATLRQARKGRTPDPVEAALVCERAGCDSIVCHLREDRRHIQERDVFLLKDIVKTKLNLEMAAAEPIIKVALQVKPHQVTLVPEKREELTTEGGLDVAGQQTRLAAIVSSFKEKGIAVSLFIEAEERQIEAARTLQADSVEFHTGRYAEAEDETSSMKELNRLTRAAELALSTGLKVFAGHGLDYRNVVAICRLPGLEELNIGYSIIGRAVFCGLEQAVREMHHLIRTYEKKNT
ncbi:MAG TPA: pyridoxine 5'-phosphate synthase [bacterium]|nr:pyridoxine 5'-phosphate synthase [bacterium]HOL67083.1 pyridoxine 5'-phosphate synthase [bacterium]HPP11863.1 pyridoxine 5'-phosphate synthase [bacterium]